MALFHLLVKLVRIANLNQHTIFFSCISIRKVDILFVAPIKSKKCWWVIQFLFFTTSSSAIARCAAGPPKAMLPNSKKTFATSCKLLF